MADCFCGCGSKVRFGMKSVNSRGRKMTELLNRLAALRDGYDESDASADTTNLQAFIDEGAVYAVNLATFVHLREDPPPALEGLTRDWLSRERKLYLDARSSDRRVASMIGGAVHAQGLSSGVFNDDLVHRISRGEFDIFAALVPVGESADMYRALADVAVESDLIEQPSEYSTRLWSLA